MSTQGCGDDGKAACRGTENEIQDNIAAAAYFDQRTEALRCQGGDRDYCSYAENHPAEYAVSVLMLPAVAAVPEVGIIADAVGWEVAAACAKISLCWKVIGAGGTVAAKTVLDGVSKPDARDALKAGIDGLTDGQIQKALDLMGKGKMDSVTINLLDKGNAQVITQVPGGDGSSFVRYLYNLDPSGKVISLLQMGYNAAGELIHVHNK